MTAPNSVDPTRELELAEYHLDSYRKAHDELHDAVSAVVDDLAERIGRLRFGTTNTARAALALCSELHDRLRPLVRTDPTPMPHPQDPPGPPPHPAIRRDRLVTAAVAVMALSLLAGPWVIGALR